MNIFNMKRSLLILKVFWGESQLQIQIQTKISGQAQFELLIPELVSNIAND